MNNCFSQLGTTLTMSSTAFCPNLKISILLLTETHTQSHIAYTDVNAVMKQNFVFSMLFTDIY